MTSANRTKNETNATGSYSYDKAIEAIAKILTSTPQIEMTIARRAGVAFGDVWSAMQVMVKRGAAVESLNADRDLVYRTAK